MMAMMSDTYFHNEEVPRQGGSCYSCYCYFTLLRIVTCSCKLDPWRPRPSDLSLLAGFRGARLTQIGNDGDSGSSRIGPLGELGCGT